MSKRSSSKLLVLHKLVGSKSVETIDWVSLEGTYFDLW